MDFPMDMEENGIHKTQVGSIRDIDDTDGRMKTYQQRNYEYESQPRSNKFFQPLKYVGNTLDTPFEQDEDSPAKSVDSFLGHFCFKYSSVNPVSYIIFAQCGTPFPS
jgi:hypothetical protein